MPTYDCDKCFARTESDEDLHLTNHIGCDGTWIWDDGFSMTEPQTTTHQKEYDALTARIAELEAQLVKDLAPRLKLSPEAQAKIDQSRAESHETRREKLFAMQLSQYQGA